MLPSASPQIDALHAISARSHLHFTLCLCSTPLLTLTSLSTSQGCRAPAPSQALLPSRRATPVLVFGKGFPFIHPPLSQGKPEVEWWQQFDPRRCCRQGRGRNCSSLPAEVRTSDLCRAAAVGSSNSFQLKLLCSSAEAAPFQQQALHLPIQHFRNSSSRVL